MNRYVAVLTLLLMFLPIVSPITQLFVEATTITSGVSLKAGTYDFYNVTPITDTVMIMDNGLLRIIINRTEASRLGDTVRIAFIKDEDRFSLFVGGYFLNVTDNYTMWFAPPDLPGSLYGGVVSITRNSTLYSGINQPCGNVTVFDNNAVILIDLSKLPPLDNVVYVTDWRFDRYTYLNLYNKALKAKVYNAGELGEVGFSGNNMIIFHIPIECSDVMINVYGSPAKYGDMVNVTVSLQRFFDKVYSVTGIALDILTSNLTNLTMVNYYNVSEEYYIASFVNGIVNYDGTPVFIPINLAVINSSTFRYDGVIDDFSPTQDIPSYPYLASLYMFIVEFRHEIVNQSMNLTFAITANSTCVYSETKPYLEIDASLDTYPIDIAGDSGVLNPGDCIGFLAHNVPDDYLGTTYSVYTFNLTNFTYGVSFPLSTFLYLFYYPDGRVDGVVCLPELPYAGLDYLIYLVFTNYKWINNSIYTIAPYIKIYTVTSTTAYAEDAGSIYIGNFVSATQSAPGNYIVIEGHGFNLTDISSLKASIFGFNITILDISTYYTNPSTGTILVLAKLLDENTHTPVPLGTDTLVFGTPGTLNTASKPFTLITGAPFDMVLFNTNWFANATGFYITHEKLGYPYQNFTVEYPLVNDTFTTATWLLPTWMEVIGWTTNPFVLKLYNQLFNMSFNWISISLTNGYGLHVLAGETIPFLPYGNYTLLEETLDSVQNRTVFTVHIGVDIDVSPCRDGEFNVTIVGGAPYTQYNLTYSYRLYELIYNKTYLIPPEWVGSFSIIVTTDGYGYGFNSTALTTLYPDSYVSNITWDMLVHLSINGTGTIYFQFLWNGSLINFTDNTTPPITYVFGPSDMNNYTTGFYVTANYNITVVTLAVGRIDRRNFTISVPETVLPGDKIIVQIFPHTIDVWNLIVDPWSLFEQDDLLGWYLDVRLVEPLTNNIVDEVKGYYAGQLIVENVDGDSDPEVWFVVNLTAPFVLGVDKTYRVDVRMFLAVLSPNTTVSGVNISGTPCNVTVDINGTVYWRGYESYWMLGGDHQIVTVLGLLEAKLDNIANGIATLEAKIDDLTTYIRVNVTTLLNAINNTVVEIKNDTAIIKADLAVIKANITTIIDLLTQINDTTTTILSCVRNIKDVLDRMEATLNETHTYVLWINGNLTNLINTVNNDVVPKFYELYHNLTIYIDTVSNYIVENISAVNNSLSLLILLTRDQLNATITSALNTILNEINASKTDILLRISDLESYLTGLIEDSTGRLELMINLTRDDLNTTLTNIYNILENKIDSYYNDLVNKIIDLKVFVNETSAWIVSNITSTNGTLHSHIALLMDNVTMQFNELKTYLGSMFNNLFARLDSMEGNIIYTINSARDYLEGVIYDAADDVKTNITMEISNCCSELKSLINLRVDELKMMINNGVSTILTRIGDVNFTIVNMLNGLNITIYDKAAEIKAGLVNLETSLTNLMNTIRNDVLRNINEARVEITGLINNVGGSIVSNIASVEDRLSTLILNINNTLTLYIKGRLDTLNSVLTDLRTYVGNQFTSMTEALTSFRTDVINTMSTMNTTLVNILTTKLEDLRNSIGSKVDTASATLSDKIDTASSRQESAIASVGGNLVLFGAGILLLEVIILALIGYSMIARRPVG